MNVCVHIALDPAHIQMVWMRQPIKAKEANTWTKKKDKWVQVATTLVSRLFYVIVIELVYKSRNFVLKLKCFLCKVLAMILQCSFVFCLLFPISVFFFLSFCFYLFLGLLIFFLCQNSFFFSTKWSVWIFTLYFGKMSFNFIHFVCEATMKQSKGIKSCWK